VIANGYIRLEEWIRAVEKTAGGARRLGLSLPVRNAIYREEVNQMRLRE
jgi:hypothetical protein